LVWDFLMPAPYPQCLLASRMVGPLRRSVFVPEGDFMISSSIVRQDPPALMILARAASEKRRAATSSLGTSKILMSSVTVPTTTAVRDVLSPRCLTSLLRETGGRLVLEATNLLWMVLQNAESDLLERNLKSLRRRC